MFSRAIARSLNASTVRARPAPVLRPVAASWTRGYAQPPPRPGRGFMKKQDQAPKSNDAKSPSNAEVEEARKAQDPEFDSKQVEFDTNASPAENKSTQKAQDADFDGKQAEFDTNASPSENTTPQDHLSKEAADAPPSDQPLPDLTQGIPSTIDYEMANKANSKLNLTEDPSPETETGGSGRGKGKLPASAYISSSEKRRDKVANYSYLAFAATCVLGAAYLGRNWEDEEEAKQHPDAPSGWSPLLWWARVKARMGDQVSYYQEPAFKKLLPNPDPMFERPYTLVISLEDLLIHSEWTREHGWRLAKRPGVDYFLRYLSHYYELVLFTSVPFAIAEPIVMKLDPYRIITWPLFREATLYENGEYIKDLSYLNRDLSKVIMIDTDPSHAKHNPENAIILPKWTGDVKDKELVSLIPFLEYIPTMQTPDVRKALKSFEGKHIPTEFAQREAIARKKFNEQLAQERKKGSRSGIGFLGSALGIKPQTMDGEQSLSEALAQGKMLQDQARERATKAYEYLEQQIRENGEKWLKEEAEMQNKAQEEGMAQMRNNVLGKFKVGGSSDSSADSKKPNA